MDNDFKTMTEVVLHIEEVTVIDLLQHVVGLDDKYLDALKPAPEGIYLQGSLEPIVSLTNPGYWADTKELITDFAKALKSKQADIVNMHGDVMLSRADMHKKARFLKPEPTLPATAIKAAVAVVQTYLNNLCRHTRTNICKYRLEQLVRESHMTVIEKDEFTVAFEKLIDQVQDFVGRNRFNLFCTKLRGGQLIIEMGVDFRIMEWYQQKFEKEQPDED